MVEVNLKLKGQLETATIQGFTQSVEADVSVCSCEFYETVGELRSLLSKH
ncbi:MAG: hypothetical protein HWQ42_07885 [Nostoc sp. JL23]|nr:hypothetical protein [Nostoc sp. JL23]MBN3893733.1 hypothetical protein [Nostoc sp. JL31]